jgi:hypothetical protein
LVCYEPSSRLGTSGRSHLAICCMSVTAKIIRAV